MTRRRSPHDKNLIYNSKAEKGQITVWLWIGGKRNKKNFWSFGKEIKEIGTFE